MKNCGATFILATRIRFSEEYEHLKTCANRVKIFSKIYAGFIRLVSLPGMFSVSARRHNIRIERKMSIQ
jgi:hypothetical protein